MVATTIHLMRHGEVHNPTGVLYGRLPGYHLSERGQQMAERVAAHLAGDLGAPRRDVTVLVASPLQRAQETAAPLAAALDLPVTTDEGLLEAENQFQGLTFGVGDGSLRHPRHWPLLVNPFRPSWGEPYREQVARVLGVVDRAREAARGHEAVLVSHQLPIWVTRLALEDRRLWHDPRRRQCSLASLTSLVYEDDRLVRIGYTEPAADLLPGASAVAGA
ncbi:histidine phosphatase family protein [Cellulomonas hominis]|jgi:broad specificity phosphatase PhoE|uniref:Broad specificity phosphatase PhoE n=1 Tax=Cellulomonas hominis TaxID=156981 RepID=A0A511F8Y4_9CELL|nr:histidine phosphatase family protein [Cellulomonas hominis]MBB5472397.1 broad specificity phosphatase PhoE [Cellulomonas hominis]MBU5421980.1 histidine phosphatase family protein [Cellulomonas hominis]NKY06697.1 histidine phosphatase family protein [Cellulomonas hominis]NKY10493.1 histidine phosphatase family protein [Cellulomonas hominis]GEL45665.1 phosphoglycerate mutase [Cellulomonas hominis]